MPRPRATSRRDPMPRWDFSVSGSTSSKAPAVSKATPSPCSSRRFRTRARCWRRVFPKPPKACVGSFGMTDDEKSEFTKKYHYVLPLDPDIARANPERWLDMLTFRSDYFLVGWHKVYKMTKDLNDFTIAINHDSHNTFGGGFGQD